MKKLLGILVLGYRIMWDKLETRLETFEINQIVKYYYKVFNT